MSMKNFIKIFCIGATIVLASIAALMWSSIRHIYSCNSDYDSIKDDIGALNAVKKYVLDRHRANSSEYQDVVQASNFSKEYSMRDNEELGWNVTKRAEDTSPFSSVDVIEVSFSGRNGAKLSCVLLQCGKLIGCRETG